MNELSKIAHLSEDPLWAWYLVEEYTMVQAALLMAGHDPAAFEDIEELTWNERPKNYEAAKNALVQRINGWGNWGHAIKVDQSVGAPIDLHASTVRFVEVRDWLAERGQTNGFFFGKEKSPSTSVPDYLNPQHPRYARKLAAAVRAWEAVEGSADNSGRPPKSLLSDWLRKHAAEFSLVSKEGKINASGIKDIAGVANWNQNGGAPKTPR